ncbi:hypothetical protein BV898_14849 [Hypsibius exemplaris]|uniref:Spondin domain-containing protein n=1 Tax=Hypsibius exemplaris TaxID=2072580 RepID=A0A9X6RJP0_HYPEX|nr:hypothetical protein BV898_14849 [Hypsibius exemplaris]
MAALFAIVALIFVLASVGDVLAANKEPTDKSSKGQKVQFLFTVSPDSDPAFKGLHFFHNQPSIIPVGNDPILDMQIHHKMAETLQRDPWETVPRLPDHDIMVGVPNIGQAPPPPMHMLHSSAGATGVQDVMIDLAARPGGTIIQTFFGERSPEMDDDDREDRDDLYDVDDDEDKKHSDDDDDDDRDGHDPRLNEVDDIHEKKKRWLHRGPEPFIIMAPAAARHHHHSIAYGRSAALVHNKPLVSAHQTATSPSKTTVKHLTAAAVKTPPKLSSKPLPRGRSATMSRLAMPSHSLTVVRAYGPGGSIVQSGGGSGGGGGGYRIIQTAGGQKARRTDAGGRSGGSQRPRPIRILYSHH